MPLFPNWMVGGCSARGLMKRQVVPPFAGMLTLSHTVIVLLLYDSQYNVSGDGASTFPHCLFLFAVFRLSHTLSRPLGLVVQAVFKLAPCHPVGLPSQLPKVLELHLLTLNGR
jgi:hypothetical protein